MALMEDPRTLTIAAALAARATRDPTAPYLISDDGEWAFAEIEARAEEMAAALSQRGLEEGERVALVLPACPEFVISFYAAAKIGAVVVPLGPELAAAELQYMLRHSASACVVSTVEHGGTDFIHLLDEMRPLLPDLRCVVTVGEQDVWYDDLFVPFDDLGSSGAGRDFIASALDGDACFALMYTSGTSGKPKAVELSHANLLSVASGTAEVLGLRGDDRIVGLSGFAHVFGLGPGLLSSLVSGAALILPAESGAEGTLDAAVRHGATVHYGIPTLYVAELETLGEHPRALAAVRLVVVSGAPVSDTLIDRLSSATGAPVVALYSVTEAASTVTLSSPTDPTGSRRFTVGRPLGGTTVRITEADDEAGTELPPESVGEVRVKGPGVMRGYYRQPRQTENAFDELGFFRTGDLGLIDEDGALHLVGRTKDVIIRAGFNVHPREVEARIESHPAVHEVAAVGMADDLLGEAVCACVVPVEGAVVTAREIVDWCRDALTEGKVPDLVRFFDELPRTGRGQVRRAELSRTVESEGPSA